MNKLKDGDPTWPGLLASRRWTGDGSFSVYLCISVYTYKMKEQNRNIRKDKAVYDTATSDAGHRPQIYATNTQYVTPTQFLCGVNTAPIIVPQPILADPDYACFMNQHGGQGSSLHVAYESKRATRQMSHYFDVNHYRKQVEQQDGSPGSKNGTSQAAVKKKPTKKELEQFKKRKEERKRIRNKWLFE